MKITPKTKYVFEVIIGGLVAIASIVSILYYAGFIPIFDCGYQLAHYSCATSTFSWGKVLMTAPFMIVFMVYVYDMISTRFKK